MTTDPFLLQSITHGDARGRLSVITGMKDLPFAFARLFWIHDVEVGTIRGAHSHRAQHQAIICMAGEIEVLIDDGANERILRLNRLDQVLHLPPLVWSHQIVTVAGTVYAVLASGAYDVKDYLDTKAEWRQARREAGLDPLLPS